MSDETPDLTALLAEHWFRVFYPGPGRRDVGCECGWRQPEDNHNRDRHAAHLAEQITAAGFGPVRAAEAALAGLREGIEAACGKSLALTQDAMGQRSQHWRGPDYADGLDQGIEIAVALVRDAIASTPNCEEGQ